MQPSEDILKLFVVFSCILILVALVFLILFFRFTQTKNEILKERLQDKLDNEVLVNRAELLALRSQMNPHFVFNALNTVQYFIQQNEMEQSEEFLGKFSQLVRNFFNYSREKDISLEEELNFITQYIEIEKLRFEDKLNYTMFIDEKIDIHSTRIPSMILQPIIENAINHGIFHKKNPGILNVDFSWLNDSTYQITIKDDGIGINESKKLYQNTKKSSKFHSTNVLDDRLKLLKDSKQWKIKYSIEDLSSSHSQSSGTLVTLTLQQI